MGELALARTPVLLAPGSSEELHREVRDTMARIDPQAFRIGAEAVWLADQRERVAKIKVPVLVLVGADDQVTPPELSHDLAGMIPGADLQTLAGAGHLANVERPNDFNDAVEYFVNAAEARR